MDGWTGIGTLRGPRGPKNENFSIKLSKIESRKKNLSCHSRKSRVEREMETIKFLRSREKFLFLLSIFLSRATLSSMPAYGYRPYSCFFCSLLLFLLLFLLFLFLFLFLWINFLNGGRGGSDGFHTSILFFKTPFSSHFGQLLQCKKMQKKRYPGMPYESWRLAGSENVVVFVASLREACKTNFR